MQIAKPFRSVAGLRKVQVAAVALSAALLLGCAKSDAPPSTGVLPAPTDATRLTSDLTLGDGDIFFARVGGITVDENGRIYVSDAGQESAIHIFEASGEYVGELGAQGEGPGEYRWPGDIFVDPDSITVFDSYYNSRLVYDRDRTPRRKLERFTAPKERHSLRTIGRTRDGSGYWITQNQGVSTGMTEADIADQSIHVITIDGVVGPQLATAPEYEMLLASTANSITMRTAPFGRQTYFVVVGDTLYKAWSADVRLEGFTVQGDSLEPIEIAYDPIPVTAADRDEAIEDASDQFRSKLVFPENRPAIMGVTSDDEGNVWIKIRLSLDENETTYWIVDPRRRTVRAVTMDGNVRVMAVRDGSAYAALTTEEGEPLVVRYPLR